jgi:hypothetical protein
MCGKLSKCSIYFSAKFLPRDGTERNNLATRFLSFRPFIPTSFQKTTNFRENLLSPKRTGRA